jgi:hypothetical protein
MTMRSPSARCYLALLCIASAVAAQSIAHGALDSPLIDVLLKPEGGRGSSGPPMRARPTARREGKLTSSYLNG